MTSGTETHRLRRSADSDPGSPQGAAPPVDPRGAVEPAARFARSNPDAPVRIEVEIPRDLHDRLTAGDDAPRSRYDMATGRAEYVAEPGMAHEGRAARVARLFGYVEDALDDAGQPVFFIIGRATRLLSDDGAFEPDECLFVDGANARAADRLEGYLDVRRGHPVPDLVVEIDRSVESSHKLTPYFRMGVREAWTWSREDGARLWVLDPEAPRGFRMASRSRVLPSLERDELHRLLTGYASIALSRSMRHLARRIARAMVARPQVDR